MGCGICGWQTGEFYFLNRITAEQTTQDPRKLYLRAAEAKRGLGVIAPARPAQDFLPTKKEETRRDSSPPASAGDVVPPKDMPQQQVQPFAPGCAKRRWSVERVECMSEERVVVTWFGEPDQETAKVAPKVAVVDKPVQRSTCTCDESHLELNLNLSPARSVPSPQPLPHTSQPVCSMEMWQEALKRTEKAMGKRELRVSTSPSSFSSFADLPPSWSCSSPSTSSSSSATKAAGHCSTIEANAKIITISNTNTPRYVTTATSIHQQLRLVLDCCFTAVLLIVFVMKFSGTDSCWFYFLAQGSREQGTTFVGLLHRMCQFCDGGEEGSQVPGMPD